MHSRLVCIEKNHAHGFAERTRKSKKVHAKNSWNQISRNFFSWNCILKLFPQLKIDFWPFLKLQKMEFGQKKFSWNWDFTSFLSGLFLIFWPTVLSDEDDECKTPERDIELPKNPPPLNRRHQKSLQTQRLSQERRQNGAKVKKRLNFITPYSYSLPKLFEHIFGELPEASHGAACDVISLIKVCSTRSRDFISYVEKHFFLNLWIELAPFFSCIFTTSNWVTKD